MTDSGFFATFGKAFVPEMLFGREVRSNLRRYLYKAGIDNVPYSFFGKLFFVNTAITFVLYFMFIYKFLQTNGPIAILLGTFVIWAVLMIVLSAFIILCIYFYTNILIFGRTKVIEDALPDFLVLVSTNLKGGLSFEQSLWAAIKPEFGLLAEEMTYVSKKVMTGSDLAESLEEFSLKYDAPTLRRNLHLIIGEIDSGGRIVQIIDKVIENLKRLRTLKSEMAASTLTYMIFIGVIVIVVSPALFALAFQLLNIIVGFTSSLGGSLGSSAMGGSPINFDVQIDSTNFIYFSIMALLTISISASMIISIIEKGDIRSGLKYIPIFTISSLILYLVFMIALNGLFGKII